MRKLGPTWKRSAARAERSRERRSDLNGILDCVGGPLEQFTGTFYLKITARIASGCGAGGYKLVTTTVGGAVPQPVQDDVNP